MYLTVMNWIGLSKDPENPEHPWYKYIKDTEIGVLTALNLIGLHKDKENPERSWYKYDKDAEIGVWNMFLTRERHRDIVISNENTHKHT